MERKFLVRQNNQFVRREEGCLELVFCLENASLFPLEEIQEVVNFFGEGIEIFEFVGFSICNRTKEFIKES